MTSYSKKAPAPGTRDGTAVKDVQATQIPQTDSTSAANTDLPTKSTSDSTSANTSLDSTTRTTDSTTSMAGSVEKNASSVTKDTTVDAPSVDKVTEETETTVDQEVLPAVEHDKIVRDHETREREVVEKEVHKDHYHTTVQPLKDREVQETEHNFEQKDTEYREFDKDDGKAKAKVDQKLAGFEDTVEEHAGLETKKQEDTVVGEHVHHHLHEIIQPVIEKGTSPGSL